MSQNDIKMEHASKHEEEDSSEEMMIVKENLHQPMLGPPWITSPHDHDEGPGGCGRAIVREFKRTIGTHWKAEATNFNQKTIAVSFFIFFAAVAPAITFGSVYSKSTNNYIGAVEMLAATAWCGVFYAIFGGQPMMINGGTGPVLAFTTVLFNMSESMDIPFLPYNAWVGIWVAIYLVIAAFVDLNKYMKHATRFTDEIFSMLIAAIFIMDALGNPLNPIGLFWYFQPSHKSHDELEDEPDYSHMATAFLSLILGLGTTWMAFWLRGFKFSRFLPNDFCRTNLANFAVVISIAWWTFVDAVIFDQVETESLNVPDTFAPTFECCDKDCRLSFPDDCPEQVESMGRRAWFVDLFDLNGKEWVPFMAAGPALLAFILVFLDDGITWHLINHPSNKLSHGEAYNYDTLIIAFCIAVNSVLGMPWLVAATVRSITHVHALTERDAHGNILYVQETRLTHFFIHLLVGVSILFLSALKVIPVPVLYGVFLFMGLASLPTNQFWCRFTYWFMDSEKYPENPYTNREWMPRRQLHKFTAIQVFLFAMLMTFRSIKVVAIAFPIVVKACIPIRMYLLPKLFKEEELCLLDAEDTDIERLVQYYEQRAARRLHENNNTGREGYSSSSDEDASNGPGPGAAAITASDRSVSLVNLVPPADIENGGYETK